MDYFSLLAACVAPSDTMGVGPQGEGIQIRSSFGPPDPTKSYLCKWSHPRDLWVLRGNQRQWPILFGESLGPPWWKISLWGIFSIPGTEVFVSLWLLWGALSPCAVQLHLKLYTYIHSYINVYIHMCEHDLYICNIHTHISNYIFFYFYTNGCFAWMYVYHMHAGRLETRKGVKCPESGVLDGLNHVAIENWTWVHWKSSQYS